MCVQQQLLMIYWCVDTTSESERYYYEAPNQNLEEGQEDKKTHTYKQLYYRSKEYEIIIKAWQN